MGALKLSLVVVVVSSICFLIWAMRPLLAFSSP